MGSWKVCENQEITSNQLYTLWIMLKTTEEAAKPIEGLCQEVKTVNALWYSGDRMNANGRCKRKVTK